MIKVESVSEASKLVFENMKSGVLTNHVMSPEEYKSDIAVGVLSAYTWPGGLVFLRGREGYQILSYFITDTEIPLDIDIPENTVVEIVSKPSGAEAAGIVVRYWEWVGLKPMLKRIRLTRPSGVSSVEGDRVFVASEQDTGGCDKLIRASFDPVTGHIPDYHELSSSIKAGHVLCLKDSEGVVCGLLRVLLRAASVEIRQLALREDMRGRGLSRNLLDAFIKKWGDRKSTVWMKDSYVPAFRTYATAGFTVDGWCSHVLTT